MKKQNYLFYILTLFLICTHLISIAQVEPWTSSENPCIGEEVEIFKDFLVTGGQSSVIDNYIPSLAFDEDYTDESTARSEKEENAWIEFDLGEVFEMSSLTIWYPDGEGMENYYILFSEQPFSGQSLGDEIASETTSHYFIEGGIDSGKPIPLESEIGRYLRVQLEGLGKIVITEIVVMGLSPGSDDIEDCGNGIDDDCDGLVDCDDPDCAPTITGIIINNASCGICNDGSFNLHAVGGNNSTLTPQISVDGSDFSFTANYSDLLPGEYEITVEDGNTGCTITEIVTIGFPLGDGNECCINGGFELGTFENWTGGAGTRPSPGNISINNTSFINLRHELLTSSYTDPHIPNLNLHSPGTGTYIARIGSFGAQQRAEKLTYCFEVNECNADFTFNFIVVLEEPDDHNNNQQAFFEYKCFDSNENIIFEDKFIADESDSRFNLANGGDIVYTNWTCVNEDLSGSLGEEVCIEFINADCSEGGHFGYTYLDGLCNSPEDNMPFAQIEMNDDICNNQEALVDASGSYNYSTYLWTMCELDANGNTLNCVEQE